MVRNIFTASTVAVNSSRGIDTVLREDTLDLLKINRQHGRLSPTQNLTMAAIHYTNYAADADCRVLLQQTRNMPGV
ncbi:hypothetical protein T265_04305 [Opisthorchis viverrini]|uniref:Uncharacterized protein n=1 Tax=Opisthorchis viverrini TaxID=6198 RepID=A0A075AGS5_OPIVI|nr:hypothetical protein T265_04305 [Opisthorchis viverrini]KER29014.1 hypothetical protein T265_04305 [Opisthorchis viverrini]